jgi:hypothetical protein
MRPQLTAGTVDLMGNKESEQILALLKELSVYKTMDEEYTSGPKGKAEIEAHNDRERRRQEIRQEIQTLATEKKSTPS